MAFLDYTGLSYFFDKLQLLFATKTEVAGKANSSHSHVGSEVTLTGYTKASSVAAVAATDTVNEAFGKVQKTLDGKQNSLTNMTATELTTGTATTARSISAKVIADYVGGRLEDLVGSAPGTLDTLNELAAALGDDPNFATTIAGQIAEKADDTGVVHKTGAETIAGAKTFTSDIKISDGTPSILGAVTGTTKGTAPAADKLSHISWYDASGTDANTTRYGGEFLTIFSNGNVRAGNIAFKNSIGSTDNATLAVTYPASGDPYGTAPATPTTGNDTDIVTRGFLASAISGQTAITTGQIDTLFL